MEYPGALSIYSLVAFIPEVEDLTPSTVGIWGHRYTWLLYEDRNHGFGYILSVGMGPLGLASRSLESEAAQPQCLGVVGASSGFKNYR